MKSTKFVVTRERIYLTKELKCLVPVDAEIDINLKITSQKTDILNQSHNIIEDTITLTWLFNVFSCNLFNQRLAI